MLHREDRLTSHDGLALYTQSWLPEGEVRAAVALVHGFTEHSGRHAPTAAWLVERGYAVHALDLRGHGRSEGARCYVARFDDYLADLDLFLEAVRAREADRPIVLMGHCLGGLIATLWAIKRQPGDCPDFRAKTGHRGEALVGVGPKMGLSASVTICGLALSAPALRLQPDLFPLLRPLARLAGWIVPHLRLARMGFGSISRDPAVVAQVRADPLVFHGRFPARAGAEILRAIATAGRHFEAGRLPLLVLHGTADRVCDPQGSRELGHRAASGDKTLHLYDGLYHEVLNEPEREQVLADLGAWLGRQCQRGGSRRNCQE